jgi:hypothetical protein
MLGCSPSNNKPEDVKTFLIPWAKALSSKDKVIKRFYDPVFEFPSVIIQDSARLSYSVDLERLEISGAENGKDMSVTMPFQLTDADGAVENGVIVLTFVTTEQICS